MASTSATVVPAAYLRIVDQAMSLLVARIHTFSCVAVWSAFCGSDDRALEMPVFQEDFKAFAKKMNGGAEPSWWGRGGEASREARLNMVAAYRASLTAA